MVRVTLILVVAVFFAASSDARPIQGEFVQRGRASYLQVAPGAYLRVSPDSFAARAMINRRTPLPAASPRVIRARTTTANEREVSDRETSLNRDVAQRSRRLETDAAQRRRLLDQQRSAFARVSYAQSSRIHYVDEPVRARTTQPPSRGTESVAPRSRSSEHATASSSTSPADRRRKRQQELARRRQDLQVERRTRGPRLITSR